MTEAPYLIPFLSLEVLTLNTWMYRYIIKTIAYLRRVGLYKAKVKVTGIRGCTVKFTCVYDIQINN